MELSLELVLGIIGCFTGVLSLIIQFLVFRTKRPILSILIDTQHFLTKTEKGKNLFLLQSYIRVNSLGERGTDINRIECQPTDPLKFWHQDSVPDVPLNSIEIKQVSLTAFPKTEVGLPNQPKTKKIIVKAHETIDFTTTHGLEFGFDPVSIELPKEIECLFIIHHTHGKEKIRVISRKINPTS